METKPGTKTTEFWTMIVVNIINLLNMMNVWNFVPNRYSAVLMAGVTGLYTLSRGWAKSGIPASPDA